MSFGEAIKFGFSNYANFQGRSPRSGFWFWYLFTVIISAALSILFSWNMDVYNTVNGLVSLALLLPSLGYAVRRLHDINKSGWFILFFLIPLVGWIFLLVWYLKDSDSTENRFGPNPKAA